MISRLGDGVEGKAETLGGGPLGNDEFTTGAKSNLFLGQRHRRHEQNLLAVSAPPSQPSGGGVPFPGGGEGAGGAGEGGDGGDGGDGGGGDGGDG